MRGALEKREEAMQSSSGLGEMESSFQPVKEVELIRGATPCSRELAISPSDDDDFMNELGKVVSTSKGDEGGSDNTSKR